MLDEKAAQEISDLCVEKIDWTVVGNKGGTMTSALRTCMMASP